MIKNKLKIKCSQCNVGIEVWRCNLRKFNFCSQKCSNLHKIGRPNKSSTKFTRGQKAWNKGKKWPKYIIEKMRQAHIGKGFEGDNGMWKGDKAGYYAMHDWIYRIKGSPKKCSHCKTTKAKKFEWANKDHSYKRILNDYIPLCTSCHRKYDIKHNNYSLK